MQKECLERLKLVFRASFYFMYLAVEPLFLDKIKDKRVRVSKTNT